jgi:PBP1b-binding outer membrane lipoprotein LpoB
MFNKLCIILISTILLSGCSASWHLRKAVSKDPSILKPTVVTIWDTIVTPAIYLVDTVSVPSETDSSVIDNDTVRIVITKFQDKIIVKTKVKEIPYTVSVQAECPPQLIQPDSKTEKVKNYLLIFLSAALAVMMFLYRFK